MKRVFKILIILVLIILVLAGGAWLLARKKASNSGQTPPTFRDFITRQSKATPGDQNSSTNLTPDTPAQTIPTETQAGGSTTPTSGPITVSQFTSAPVTPSQTEQGGSDIEGVGGLNGGFGSGTGINGSPITVPTGGQIPIVQGITGDSALSGCQDSDVNIEFTAEEIARLNELQSEFNQIAGTLHTDADIQAEESNYTLFKDKVDTSTELYNYCLSKGFTINSTPLKNRIATPFWRMPGRDKSGYLRNGLWDDGFADPRNVSESEMMLEHFFKLNLW